MRRSLGKKTGRLLCNGARLFKKEELESKEKIKVFL